MSEDRTDRGRTTAAVVILGSLNVDLVVDVATLPGPGETRLGSGHRRGGGGKGANQAVAAARAGATTSMVGAVGDDDDGRLLVEGLAADGIQVAGIDRATAPTGLAMIMVAADGDNLIAVSPGANATVGPAQVARAASLVGPGTVLLCQLEVPLDAVVAAAGRARAAGGLVVINPSPVPPAGSSGITDLLSLTDVLVVNETEARTLSGIGAPSGSQARTAGEPDGDWPAHAARALRAMGCGSVVITLGGRGCLTSGPDGEHRVPAVEVRSVDAVAAGDSFLGALVCELAGGATLAEAARVGSAAGALAVGRRGAQASIPHRVEIDAVLAAGRIG